MRDPRIDPQAGDVLLTGDGPIIVGRRTGTKALDGDEVQFGCGDHRYWYIPIAEWQEQMASAEVLYALQHSAAEVKG